jgi:putative ubiquitin-RnfH superfamily antitoxin RatB of RatAB toxin-antitoxin module
MRVTVLYSPAPREVLEWQVILPEAATVRQALQASGLSQVRPALDVRSADVGVWGRKGHLDQVLREGDRVEVYRPLLVDPKLARRERFVRQGGRTGGLFARGQNRRGG